MMSYVECRMPDLGATMNYPSPNLLPDPVRQVWLHVSCDAASGYCTYRAADKRTGDPILANGVNPTKGTGQPLAVDDDSNRAFGREWYSGVPLGSTTVWPPAKPTASGGWTIEFPTGWPQPLQVEATHTHEWREVHLFSSSVTECKTCGILKPDEKK